jgi:hypothetical protein
VYTTQACLKIEKQQCLLCYFIDTKEENKKKARRNGFHCVEPSLAWLTHPQSPTLLASIVSSSSSQLRSFFFVRTVMIKSQQLPA